MRSCSTSRVRSSAVDSVRPYHAVWLVPAIPKRSSSASMPAAPPSCTYSLEVGGRLWL